MHLEREREIKKQTSKEEKLEKKQINDEIRLKYRYVAIIYICTSRICIYI